MKLPRKVVETFPRRAYNAVPRLIVGTLRRWPVTAKEIAKLDAKYPPCESGFLSDLMPEKWAAKVRRACDLWPFGKRKE